MRRAELVAEFMSCAVESVQNRRPDRAKNVHAARFATRNADAADISNTLPGKSAGLYSPIKHVPNVIVRGTNYCVQAALVFIKHRAGVVARIAVRGGVGEDY